MKRFWICFIAAALAVCLLSGCNGYVTYDFDVGELEVIAEEGFILTYEENTLTGEPWVVHFRGDAELELVGDESIKNVVSLFRKGYTKRKLTIKANQVGVGVVYLTRENYDNEETPVDTRVINVDVQPRKTLGIPEE